MPGDGCRDFWFSDGTGSAEARVGGFAFGSGAWLIAPTTISAAISAADALPINTRIAIVDESIVQIEGQQYYARRQENACSPNMNKLGQEHDRSQSMAVWLSEEAVLGKLAFLASSILDSRLSLSQRVSFGPTSQR